MIYQFGATSLGLWVIKYLISPFQRNIYRISEGKALSSIGSGKKVLLLTTKGHRSGKERTIPVFYLQDGKSIIICNVRPKPERINPWVINLSSHPVAYLQIGHEREKFLAHQATDDEISIYWPQLVKLWPAFQVHHERGGERHIFILKRA
jgi:deazaflavin-dependent oxidoreductase (nitroreductase family)